MRRLAVALVGLALCGAANFASPRQAWAAEEPFTCQSSTGCEEMTPTQHAYWCGSCIENDHVACGGAGYQCDAGGWDIECICVPEDENCPNPCDVT